MPWIGNQRIGKRRVAQKAVTLVVVKAVTKPGQHYNYKIL